MSYTSIKFLIFVTVTILVYFLFPKKWKEYKWTVLLLASYVFYLFAGVQYVGFILFTTASTFFGALWMDKMSKSSKNYLREHKADLSRDEKKKLKERTKRNKRLVVALILILNFGILAFLKYAKVLFMGGTGDLLVVLGISFYTFQSMGYIIDIYRDTVPAQRNFLKFALFVSFFPQIVQGPIGIYSSLAEQLYKPHSFDYDRFRQGFLLILWGLFKKMAIADNANIAISAVTDHYQAYGGTTLLFTVILYAFQLYMDFSGGIDISRGVAQIFGIDMMENFRRPYFSKDISEYWRRWHISLGNWFKTYLFYPLAMSSLFLNVSKNIKKSKFGSTKVGAHIAKVLPTSFASFIVFFMVGVWHGANWKYVAFGVYNGGIIMLAVLLKPVFESVLKKLHINPACAPYTAFRIIRTFILVLVGYVFDVAPSFEESMMTFRLIFTDQNLKVGYGEISELGLSKVALVYLAICAVFIFIISVIQERNAATTIRSTLIKKPAIVRWGVVYLAIMAILIFGVYGSGFNAADFVYAQF